MQQSTVNLHAWAIGHLQKCPSPAECFLEHSNGKKKVCPKEVAWNGLRDGLGGQKKKRCVWCLPRLCVSQRIWLVSSLLHWHKLQEQGFQLLSTNTWSWVESRKNTPNAYFESEIWSACSPFCIRFSVDTRGTVFAVLWFLATNRSTKLSTAWVSWQ